MKLARFTRAGLAVFAALVVLFLLGSAARHRPLAFDKSNVQSLPIRHWTTHWFAVAFNDPAVRSALWLSVKAGLAATLIALVSALSWRSAFTDFVSSAVTRFRSCWFYPIALPGIVTGLALQSAFNLTHIDLSIYTIHCGPRHFLHGRCLQ